MARKPKIPGVSFSWKRAVGVTSAKQKIARKTGIPTTKQGRQRKIGAAMGCMIPMSVFFVLITIIISIALF